MTRRLRSTTDYYPTSNHRPETHLLPQDFVNIAHTIGYFLQNTTPNDPPKANSASHQRRNIFQQEPIGSNTMTAAAFHHLSKLPKELRGYLSAVKGVNAGALAGLYKTHQGPSRHQAKWTRQRSCLKKAILMMLDELLRSLRMPRVLPFPRQFIRFEMKDFLAKQKGRSSSRCFMQRIGTSEGNVSASVPRGELDWKIGALWIG